ncbi:hypothetical protein KR50_27490 [Jeotgalibacillus campisalis]|uniref:Uncharacterized protein n=1 Tax=Jeotgalibacillus campisalis TaxID=220754 RepID=A0A0C2RWF9_9BACL|nr:hypothetical protein KR50_27490 [Jeotgalibacillus campisalis]
MYDPIILKIYKQTNLNGREFRNNVKKQPVNIGYFLLTFF